MERRFLKAVSGKLKSGVICVILGGVFVILDLNVAFRLKEVWLLGAVYTVIGLIPGIIGVRSLVSAVNTYKRIRELVDQGRYVWAEITDCELNMRIKVNNAHPKYLIARYADAMGRVREFQSLDTFDRKVKNLVGQKVRVYLGSNVDDYYMDYVELFEQ